MIHHGRRIFRTLSRAGWTLSVLLLTSAATVRAAEPASGSAFPELPLSFVANAGQLDDGVEFSTSQGNSTLLLGATETMMVSAPAGDGGGPTIARTHFVGADPAVQVEGRDRLPGVAHFYRGNDPKRWVSDVPTYGAAARVDLYPGITQIYRSSDGRWKSEFRVAPGADPAQILLEYSGIESLEIDATGALVLRTAAGEWRESAPVVYQEIASRRREVTASYRLFGSDRVGFTIGAYELSHELLIDPTLTFSSYLGGSAADSGAGVAVDSAGNVIVCGTTSSTDFPLLNPASATQAGSSDFFVAKFAADGTLLYSTYLGGSGRELASDIAVDPSGNAYFAGWTASTDLPTTSGVLGTGPFGVGGSVDDAAVAKLDAGGALVWATYLGGASDDQVQDISVDADGHAYVMGHSVSADFPTTPLAYQTVNQGIWDVFVSKLETDASALIYSTFIGDVGYEEPWALALDRDGNTYVLGRTQSSDFPLTSPVYDSTYNGDDTVFLSKLDSDGGTLVYSTFLDGIAPRFQTHGFDVAVDDSGHAYVVAPTEGSGFPATPGVYDPTFNGGTDLVVMKVSPTADSLIYSTYIGATGVEEGHAIAFDACGGVVVSGYTESADFSVVDPLAGQASLNGARDGFMARLNHDGTALTFASFLGGSNSDSATALALSMYGGTCVGGSTVSTDFPVAGAPPFQPAFGGGTSDAFASCVEGLLPCSKIQRLYTVTDTNKLVAIDVDNHNPGAPFSATTIGVTRDANGGPTRRIRGLASVGLTLYGMTREGDLVRIDPATGLTTHVYSLVAGDPATEFWGGLAFDGTNKLYTANAFDGHELVELTLMPPSLPIERIAGPTLFSGSSRQILGVEFYPSSAPTVPPTSNGMHPTMDVLYGSNRNNQNVVVVDTADAEVTMPFGNHTAGNNIQAIAFHPVTGELYTLHDHHSSSNNASLSTYNFTTEMTSDLGVLPFGIVESVGGGNDTYGWGGLAFGPFCQPPPTTVSCRIFEDINGNGTQDPGEPGKAGVDVLVTDRLGNLQTVTTDAAGDCGASVPPGDTTLDIDDGTLPPGSAWTAGTDPTMVTVPPCGTIDVVNGCQLQGDLTCHLFEDWNGNGIQDPGEPDKPGVDVSVTDSQGNLQTLTTDAAGNCGAVVPAGSTLVDVDDASLPAGTILPPGTDPMTVNVPAGGAADAEFGCQQTADLAIEKTNNRDSVISGSLVTYTVGVTNPGPSNVFGATVTDLFPGLVGVTWNCSATAGSSCTSSGSGAITDTVDVLVGGMLTYSALGTVDPSVTGTLENTAIVSVPAGSIDLDPSNNTATDSDPIQHESCPCSRQFTFLGGLMDDFDASTPEQAFRSAALEAAFPLATWKDFDDTTINRFFGHTFTNLPGGIVSAVLEIRMRPNGGLSTNDSFGTVLVNGTEMFTAGIAADLPEANGTWSQNQPAVFLVDLGAFVAQINGALDVRIEDDTTVDYVKLHVVFCRTPLSFTRRCGLRDDFALPVDPIFRSAALDAKYPGATWKDLDDMSSNSFVGHTLINLPSELLGAELELRMKPHSDNPTNDTLNLALLPNSNFLFGTNIDALPEAGGVWNGNPPTVFRLDLGAIGVVPQMAADHFLDVLVADDTAVDYMDLRLQACRRLRFSGLPYRDLGDALLLETAAAELEIVGIDDGGDDGLAVDVGEAQGYCLATNAVCLGNKGTALQLEATGHVVNFNQSTVTGTLTFGHTGGTDVDLTVGFSPPFDQNASVTVINSGTQVASEFIATGAVVRVPEDTCIDEFDFLDRCFRVLLTDAVPVTILQGGPTVVGDEVLICRDIIVGLETVLTELSLTARNLPSLTVTGGALQMFGQLHKPLGVATFQASGSALTLADLSDSGDDGATIDLGQARSFDLDFVDLDPLGTTSVGAMVGARAIGSLDGIPDQPLGELAITKVGTEGGVGSLAIDADFTTLDSPTQRVQIFSAGALVADVPGHTGTAAFASAWPVGLGKLGGETECFVSRHPLGTMFTLDGSEVVGDEIRILSEGSAIVDFKSGFEIVAAGLGELTIVSEDVVLEDIVPGDVIFMDGFESGDTSAWSGVTP